MKKTDGHPEEDGEAALQASKVDFRNKNNTTSASVKYKLGDEDLDKLVVETSRQVSRITDESNDDVEHNAAGLQLAEQSPPNDEPSSRLLSGDVRSISSQPKRPMNAFMVWGQAIRRYLHHRFSNVQNALLSKALGRIWKILDAKEKEPFVRKANLIKANHKRDYPNYRYQPRRFHERRSRSSMLIGINLNHPVNQHLRPSTSSGSTIHYTTSSANTANNQPVPAACIQVDSSCKQNSNLFTTYIGRPYRCSSLPEQPECNPFESQVYSSSMQSIGYQLNVNQLKESDYRGISYYNPTASGYNHHSNSDLTYQDHLPCTAHDKPAIEYAFSQNHQQMSAYNLAQHNYHHHGQIQQQIVHSHHNQQQADPQMLGYEISQQLPGEPINLNTVAIYAAPADANCHMSSVQSTVDNSLLSDQGKYSQIFRAPESNNQTLGFNNKF